MKHRIRGHRRVIASELRAEAVVWSPGPQVGHASLEQALIDIRDTKKRVLIHMQGGGQAELRSILSERFGFDELAADDAIDDVGRPMLRDYGTYLMLSAPWLTHRDGEDTIIEVSFFLGTNFLVAISAAPCEHVQRQMARWMEKPRLKAPDPGQLLYEALDAFVDEFFPAIERIDDLIDQLETTLYDHRLQRDMLEEALAIKHRVLSLRRRMPPLRDVLSGLMRAGPDLVGREYVPKFQSVQDHVFRVTELADLHREILATLSEAHLSIVSNDLNLAMRLMTVVATVLMSLGVVVGVYGMNFRHMPELEWNAGYPLVLVLMVVISAAEVWIFRRKGWI